MSLLTLENIVKEYRNQCVLNGVSLRIERGERVGLVGPNGAGKTTLLKIAMGLETCDRGRVVAARHVKVGYLSQDLSDLRAGEEKSEQILRYEKAAEMESKLRSLERQLAEESNAQDPVECQRLMDGYSRLLTRYEAIDGYTIEVKMKKILLGLGLRPETLSTPVQSLSGGEKMRVLVARILLEEPDLLVLDEPTNHLDIQATEWFEGFLKKFGGGVLFVSHDRQFLDKVATRIAELEGGTLSVLSGNYSDYAAHKQQLSQFVINEQKRLRWMIRSTNETVQGLKSRGKIRAAKSREKSMQKLRAELDVNLKQTSMYEHLQSAGGPKIGFKKIKHISKDIAWADNLAKSFGDVVLFSAANFHLKGGERVGIIGPNGSGKTTLIQMLIGNDNEYEGYLRLGEWVKYSYVGQEVVFQNESLSMLELIESKGEMSEREARDHLARFQFYGDEVEKRIDVLSGGERVRLYLACVMLEEADCLILDEPTNHLDMPARDAVEAALRDFRGTIIAVTHDRYFLTHCVQKILAIEDGTINTYNGNYDFYRQVRENIEVERNQEKVQDAMRRRVRQDSDGKREDRFRSKEQEAGEVEAQILGLEERIRKMESSFDESTPREVYLEYKQLVNEAQQLYQKWDKLISQKP